AASAQPIADSIGRARASVEEIRTSLRRWQLARNWARTWHPKRYNPGERGYWLSWFLPWNPRAPLTSLRTKRTEFLAAIEVAVQVFQLRALLLNPVPDGQQVAVRLFNGVAGQVIGRDTRGALWLMHPEQIDDGDELSDPDHQATWHEVDGYDSRPVPAR